MTQGCPDSILIRVQKLLALANKNTNVNEAAAAASAAQRLIEQYNLDMAQVAAAAGKDEVNSEEIRNDFTPLYEGQRAITWKASLANDIAKANNCRVFLSRGDINVVGKATGVELTRFLFNYVSAEIERLCALAIKADRYDTGKLGAKTWSNNFKLGAIAAIRDNLHASQAEIHAKYAGSQAMVLIQSESQAVERWLKSNMRLRTKQASSAAGNSSARHAGYVAGKSIDLNRTGLGAGVGRPALGN